MNNCLVVYIKRNVACNINNDTIIQQFQNMKISIDLRFFFFFVIYEVLFLLDLV